MDLETFQFSQPLWLWGLIAIPTLWAAFFLFYRPRSFSKHLESMIDTHLLPFLLVEKKTNQASTWVWRLLSWSIIWACLMVALAGPRWSFRDIDMMSKDQSLVILLDLSESMNATDVKPSRIVRARQKIEDLLQGSQGTKIGLIAFAADPHMITPLTDDKETIRHLLPSLNTDLVYIQGSRLSPALKMASKMLEAEPGRHQALVIISDGGFEDRSAIADVKKLAEQGVVIHAMGIGTVEGAVLKDDEGNIVKKNGKPIVSKLEREPLQEISKVGTGFYIEANYSSHDESAILDQLQCHAEAISAGKKMRLWDEGFIFFLLPAIPLFLYSFRRGVALMVVVWAIAIPFSSLQAEVVHEYFMNSEEAGADAFDKGDYQEAAETFQDPYRKGVAYYKAGNFEEAEKMFKLSTREDIAHDAAYNLGNALAWQQKFQEAVDAYEEVLKQWPDDQQAKENLELIKKLLEQQKEEQQQNSDSQEQQDKQQDSDGEGSEDGDPQGQQDEKNEQQSEGGNSSGKQQQDSSEGDTSENDQDKEGQSDRNEAEESDSSQKEGTQDKTTQEQNAQSGNGEETKQEEVAAEGAEKRSQQDLDADMWLNRLTNDPQTFLKNKFYIESKKNGTREGIDPW